MKRFVIVVLLIVLAIMGAVAEIYKSKLADEATLDSSSIINLVRLPIFWIVVALLFGLLVLESVIEIIKHKSEDKEGGALLKKNDNVEKNQKLNLQLCVKKLKSSKVDQSVDKAITGLVDTYCEKVKETVENDDTDPKKRIQNQQSIELIQKSIDYLVSISQRRSEK